MLIWWGRRLLFGSVARRILLLNIVALILMAIGIKQLGQFRKILLDNRINALSVQAELVVEALKASQLLNIKCALSRLKFVNSIAVTPYRHPSSWGRENAAVIAMVKKLVERSNGDLRIFDRYATELPWRKFVADNWFNVTNSIDKYMIDYNIRPIGARLNLDATVSQLSFNSYILPASIMKTVREALEGERVTGNYNSEAGSLVFFISLPIIDEDGEVLGALYFSAADTDIKRLLFAEEIVLIKIFAGVLFVMVFLSLLLASTIAQPLRVLAAFANKVKTGIKEKHKVPDFSNRLDEVGQLSEALRSMIDSLYNRIENTERFAADVSHELKNPLTSLRSVIETLPLIKDPAAQNKLLAILKHDVIRLDRLITDIAKVSRLEAELVRSTAEEVDLQQLLAGLVQNSNLRVDREKGVVGDSKGNIELVTAPLPADKTGFLVNGHMLRLRQVFVNLIDNAQSFIPKEGGRIYIYLEYIGDTSIKVTIQDNGPGVQAEEVHRIFERFYTDRPGAENFGNHSGLGLSISEQIVSAHGGKLSVENITNTGLFGQTSGASFSVLLPAQASEGSL